MGDQETAKRQEPGHEGVTDAEIQAIIDQGEAGTNDLLAAYEPIEQRYFQAVTVDAPSVTNSIDTNPR
jgi:hypothetical protein